MNDAPLKTVRLTPDQLAARNRRNLFIALGLVAFIVLIFTTTLLRMQRNMAERNAQTAIAGQGVTIATPSSATTPAAEPAR